jgi:hypothetical protein
MTASGHEPPADAQQLSAVPLKLLMRSDIIRATALIISLK